jgi:hypothetical protein
VISIPVVFKPLSVEQQIRLRRWMVLPESNLFRGQLEVMALKKMVEAADALAQDDMQKANTLSKEGRDLDHLLELFNNMGQGYVGEDVENKIELLEVRAAV